VYFWPPVYFFYLAITAWMWRDLLLVILLLIVDVFFRGRRISCWHRTPELHSTHTLAIRLSGSKSNGLLSLLDHAGMIHQHRLKDVDEPRERILLAWDELDQHFVAIAVSQWRNRLQVCVCQGKFRPVWTQIALYCALLTLQSYRFHNCFSFAVPIKRGIWHDCLESVMHWFYSLVWV